MISIYKDKISAKIITAKQILKYHSNIITSKKSIHSVIIEVAILHSSVISRHIAKSTLVNFMEQKES